MRRADKPLSQRLTAQMIRVQLVTLALFVASILLVFVFVPASPAARHFAPPDPSVLTTVEEALYFSDAGQLAIAPTQALTRLVEHYPAFWFMAVPVVGGPEVTYGPLPPEAEPLRRGIRDIVSMQVMLELETGNPTLLVRSVNLAGQTIKIALGSGPTLGVQQIIQTVTVVLMVVTFVLLALASAIAIPRFIRKELSGLSAAATAAAAIDVSQRGMRIPEEDLPAEIKSLVRAVNDALERLDDSHSRRERFLADAAHELRTPIAVLLARIESTEPFKDRDRLLADVARLGELTNQLLDVQRLSLSEPVFIPVDLTELGAAVVADLAPLAIAAGYELELSAPDTQVAAPADPGSLYRAVVNLVRNAISHGGKQGRIVVAVRAPAIIEVSDDGPGITPGEEERIFDPFHRSSPSSEGAGLGLSLVDSIIRRHKGSIATGRSATGGARFTIILPSAGSSRIAAR